MSVEKKDRYMVRHAAGAYYLVFLGGESYRQPLRMNDSAHFIFTRFTEGADKGEIAEAMAAEYGVSKSDIMEDVEDFIALLEKNGLTSGE